MEDENKTLEQQKAEQAMLDGKKTEDIRAEIIAEYGFDESADEEKINKLVNKTVEQNKKLSKAIEQKIKHRTEAEELKRKFSTPSTQVQPNTQQKAELTPFDTIALFDAKVTNPEDIQEVMDYAKFKNISVAEALKLDVVKTTLTQKSEFRRSAETAAMGGRRVTTKVTPEKLVSDLKEGKVPERGSREAEELFWARRGGKK